MTLPDMLMVLFGLLMRTEIYPGIAGYGFKSLGQGMEAGWVSHGLAHLSSAAKAQDFAIDLIDLRALSGWDEFRDELRRRQPDVAAGSRSRAR